MKSQKQGVLDAITQVKGSITGELTKSEFAQVSEIVASEILNGEVTFSDEARVKYDTAEKILAYTRGMVNNWLRKAPELNGGYKYEPSFKKGPQGDNELKALKLLAKQFPDNSDVAAAIAEKEAKISQQKAPKIDASLLPAHLRHLVG